MIIQKCRVRKLFRRNVSPYIMVKLTDRAIRWIVKHVENNDVNTKLAASIYGVSMRRVQQLVKEYRETGRVPQLTKRRRPKTYLTEEQKEIIDKVWNETRVGARLLYYELKRRGYNIPHNKIHAYLRKTGKTIPNPNKQKKRKRCRYERKHSCSLIHGDWHRRTENDPYAIIWIDDASRYILAGGEFDNATADYSIETLRKAQKTAMEYNAEIKEVNTDRGTQFYSTKKKPSKFEAYVMSQGIKFIPSRKNNPQTNGKLERLWYEYDKHRFSFENMDEFISWYNHRIHGALWLEIGERPEEAFWRKLPPESLLGLFLKMNGW